MCGLITPWNFPAAVSHWFVAGKGGVHAQRQSCSVTYIMNCALSYFLFLASGSSAVVKPAENTPLTALALAELGNRAGVPSGHFSVLPTPRSAAAAEGKALCKHEKKNRKVGSCAVCPSFPWHGGGFKSADSRRMCFAPC